MTELPECLIYLVMLTSADQPRIAEGVPSDDRTPNARTLVGQAQMSTGLDAHESPLLVKAISFGALLRRPGPSMMSSLTRFTLRL